MYKEKMECDYCDHIEYYEDENSFFQGEMFGLEDHTVSCPNCLNKLAEKINGRNSND